jgi:RNA 2',3'-cyclic 3'-phosphodiesterase
VAGRTRREGVTVERGGGRRRPPEPPADHPRLFVAVPLDEAARQAVVGLVDDVQADVNRVAREPRSEVRWVRLDGLHLTVRFLGATQPGRVNVVSAAVDAVASGARAFGVSLGGAGAFPSGARPRTLWLGVRDGRDELAQIAGRLDDQLVAGGWPHDDRPFRAHLTLARADGRREGPFVARTLEERASRFETTFAANRLVLFESVTGGGPARYVALHEAPLTHD